MNLPKNAGRYIAIPTEWSVSESGANKLPTFVCKFALTGWIDGEGEVDVAQEGMEITGYFYLVKRDGNLNTITIESLKAALGWDGASFATLANNEWSQTEVQLAIKEEEYNGKTQIKVAYINPRDWTPSGFQNDPQVIQSLDARYGSMLRAISPQQQAPPKDDVKGNRTAAWNAFVAKTSPDGRNNAWREAVNQFFGAADEKSLTADQWKKFSDAIRNRYQAGVGFPMSMRAAVPVPNPISEEPQFTEEDIPFDSAPTA